jgi:hypothetical protein
MHFCPNCGVERVARFCSGCGLDFDQLSEPPLTVQSEGSASDAVAMLGEGAAPELALDSEVSQNQFEETLTIESESEHQREQLPQESITDSIVSSEIDLPSEQPAEDLERVDTAESLAQLDQLASLASEAPSGLQDPLSKGENSIPNSEEDFSSMDLVQPEARIHEEPNIRPGKTTKPEGWYPDPINKFRFRYWDGNVWTDRTATRANEVEESQELISPNLDLATPVILEGLAYGKKYRSGSSCFNCGFMPLELTNFCECCGANLKSAE